MQILIVDDEPNVAFFLAKVAKLQGVKDIEVAGSGEEALAKVIQHTYDLITLDINMPGLSGLEILALLRNMCPHAIIAIISGNIPKHLPSEMACCVDVMLSKPVTLETLGCLIGNAVRIHEAMDEIRSLASSSVTDGLPAPF